VIAVAHRLGSLRNFDRVVVLRHGRIVEDGAPDQLIAEGGFYRSLIERERARLADEAR